MPRTTRKSALKRGRQVRWPIEPDQFRIERTAALLSPTECAKVLGVSERTIRNWEASRAAIPYAAFKLLRVLTGGELPGRPWDGFYVKGDTLWTPERKRYDAGELAYINNVFTMARFWLENYHRNAAIDRANVLLQNIQAGEDDPSTKASGDA